MILINSKVKLDQGCPNGTNTPAPTFVISKDLFKFNVKFFKSRSNLEVKVMDQNFGEDRKVLRQGISMLNNVI